MQARIVHDVPDSTYFTMSDVSPKINGDTIELTDGVGTRRSSWGAPQATSTVVVESCEFIAVHVGFSHKHRGGQGWFYYVATDNGPQRRTWAQLTEDEQGLVLANLSKAPKWAKVPGVRKSERKAASPQAFVAYKVLRVTGPDEFESMYDRTPWRLGKRNGKAVGEGAGTKYDPDWGIFPLQTVHDGGFYVHQSAEKVEELFLARKLAPQRTYLPGDYALVECECSGRVAKFSNGKLAVTYCKPVRVVKTITI